MKGLVKEINRNGKADLIVVLSYAGEKKDKQLIHEVDGIDLVLGKFDKKAPLHSFYRGAHIFRAEPYAKNLWQIGVQTDKGNTRVDNFKLIELKNYKNDPGTTVSYNRLKSEINKRILDRLKLHADNPVAETFPSFEKTNNGDAYRDLINDSLYHFYKKNYRQSNLPETNIVLTIADSSAGICPDKYGMLFPEDLFMTVPGSINEEGTPEDSLVLFKLSIKEIKLLLEIACNFKKYIGADYSPHFSGLKAVYNNFRLPLDKITSVELKGIDGVYEKVDDMEDDGRLCIILSTEQTLLKLQELDNHPIGFFEINPRSIISLKERTSGDVDLFSVFTGYLKNFRDVTGNTVPDIQAKYKNASPWLIEKSSSSLKNILKNPSSTTVTVIVVILSVLLFFISLNVAVSLLFRKKQGK